MLRREGVVSGVETQDGHRCVGELFVWAGITVVLSTRFITKEQSGEALVELTDRPRLEEREWKRGEGGEEKEIPHVEGDERGTFKTWSTSTTFSRTFLCLWQTNQTKDGVKVASSLSFSSDMRGPSPSAPTW